MAYRVPSKVLDETFQHFRRCGRGRRECQALWLSAWQSQNTISQVIHPRHLAHGGGFEIDSKWLNEFWLQLAQAGQGIRIQIHTHPCEAFHSTTDDDYPIIHSVGFLSLVIPNFGLGRIGFDGAFLAEIGVNGRWREIPIRTALEIV